MGSFRKRLLILLIGLVVVTQTVTLAAVLASTARTVRARAADQLLSGGSYARQLVRFRSEQLANAVSVLAADFGFREAVASGDHPTILSAAANSAQRVGADMVLLLDTQGRLIAATAPEAGKPGRHFGELLRPTPSGEPDFLLLGKHGYEVFVAPVRTPETIAYVAMGFAVGDSLARQIAEAVGAQVVILAQGASGAVPLAGALSAALPGERMAGCAAAAHSGRILRLGGGEYLCREESLGQGQVMSVLLLKPMHEVLAPYRDVRNALLLIDGIALLLAAAVGVRLGRSATRPIGELVRAALRIQEGRYDTAVQVSGGDEFRSLAATFNAMQRDIAEREAAITHQAYHDAVTGLPNRARVERELAAMLEQDPQTHLALVLLDLRNLRQISATLGHGISDEVLRESARRLKANVAPGDCVARLGESQLLILARNCRAERARLYAEQLSGLVRTGFHLSGARLDLHLACGVCLCPEHGSSADTLLQRVQIATEDAPVDRARPSLYESGRDEQHRRRLAVIAGLRRAMESDALSLVFQPKVALQSRSLRSFEALLRWNDPELGSVTPGEFIPLAESTGAARGLTSWVLAAAIRQMSEWRRAGLELELAVNLSAPDILDPELGEEILSLLRQHRVEPSMLCLEITESAVMRDPQVAARHMRLMQVAGVHFSIDDFGTGHSSLSQLGLLPVDELKVDRSFIARLRSDPQAEMIVRATVELAHRMELRVVAEGVETPEDWNLLRRLGCDYAQGYLIARPLPAPDVPAFTRRVNQILPDCDSTVLQMRALEQLAPRR